MSIVLIIASFISSLFLLIVYDEKMKSLKVKRKIFYILIFTFMIMFLVRILQLPVLIYVNNKTIQAAFIKFSWICTISTSWMLYLYYVYHANNINDKSILDVISLNTNTKIVSILNVIFIVCVIFPPLRNFDSSNFIFPGNLLIFYYMTFGIDSILIDIGFIIKWDKIKKNKRIPLILVNILLFFLMVIQYYFQSISVIEFLLTLALYVFYFNVENPDLEIVEEKINTKDLYEKNNKIITNSLSLFPNQMNTYIDNIYDSYIKLDKSNEKKLLLNSISHNAVSLYDLNTYLSNLSTCNNKNIYYGSIYNSYELIKRIYEYAKKRINNSEIKFELKIDQNIPILLIGDYEKIYYVITNLINMSILNTEVGKIILNISSRINGNIITLNINIEDTGNGITKNQIDIINSINTQNIENDYNTYLIKKYIEVLKGTIKVISMELAGNKFNVNVAQNIANPTPLSAYSINFENDIYYTNYSNKKIAFVNNNKKDTKIFEDTMIKYNVTMDESLTLKDLIDKLKLGSRYDIIFVDKDSINDKDLKLIPILNYLSINKPPIIYIDSNINDIEKRSILNDGIDEIIYVPLDKIVINNILLKYLGN